MNTPSETLPPAIAGGPATSAAVRALDELIAAGTVSPFGIRAWLQLIGLLAGVPMFVLAGVLTWSLLHQQQEAAAAEVRERATAAATAVRRRIDRAEAELRSLATSTEALADDLPGLHAHARRMLEATPDGMSIVLTRPDGAQVFTARRPWGTALPRSQVPEHEAAVFRDGRSTVSPLYHSQAVDRKVFFVGVPLMQDGRIAYALRLILPAEAMTGVIADQQLPERWTGTVIDQRWTVVARSRPPYEFVGQRVTSSVEQAMAERGATVYEAISLDGMPVTGFAAPVEGTGWRVSVAVPTDTLQAPVRRSMLSLAAAGVLCLLFGAAASFGVAEIVGRQIRRVAQQSAGARDGVAPPPAPPPLLVREVGEIARALEHKREQAAHAMDALHLARHDALTQLPMRALFEEQAAGLRREADAGGRAVAALFLDLDGFKEVNDRLGHEAGDRILRRTAEAIRSVVRDGDVFARIAGDEFVVMLADAPARIGSAAHALAERLREQVAAFGDGIGCSIGVAVTHDAAVTNAALLQSADRAMLSAKRAGRNRVRRVRIAAVGGADDDTLDGVRPAGAE